MAYEEHFGYKAFDSNRKNQIGQLFEEGKIYTSEGELRPGMYDYKNMNGYHMSENIANVFRFFDSECDGITVAEVRGFGECLSFEDTYNEYFDMYVCQNLEILKFLSREEIIENIVTLNEFEIVKFLNTYKLNEEEKTLLSKQFKNNDIVYSALQYFQYNNKDVYQKRMLLR